MSIQAIGLADKITAMAEGAVSALDRTIAAWPAEFRAIMWFAVAEVARHRADEAKRAHSEQQREGTGELK